MRFVFVNLHVNDIISIPLFYFLTRRRASKKHGYLLKYLLDNQIRIGVYLDGKTSSYHRISQVLPQRVEFYLWCIVNRVSPLKFEIIESSKDTTRDDVLFSYFIGSDKDDEFYKGFKGLRLFHATHYMTCDKQYFYKKLSDVNPDYFVAEANLSKNNPFFSKIFDFYTKDVLVLPFVAQDRFKNIIDFKQRNNKALAVGSLAKSNESDYKERFGTVYFSFARQMIYENMDTLSGVVDNYIFPYDEGHRAERIQVDDDWLVRNRKRLRHIFVYGAQRQYYKLNMVKLFNSYRMAVTGEEVSGLPVIGFVEAMACGCAYIGVSNRMYEDIGMLPGVHYISYDGSLKDLKEKILYYQDHEDQLRQIASNGHNFVLKELGAHKVASVFIEHIKEILNKGGATYVE